MDFFEQEAKEAEAIEAELAAEMSGEPASEEPAGEPEAPQGREAADPAPEGEGGQETEGKAKDSEQEPGEDLEVQAETERLEGGQKTDGSSKEEEAKPDAEQAQKKKPPEGFVEIQAMKEARDKMKGFRDRAEKAEAENQALLMEVQRLMSGEAAPKKPEFKELTAEELNDLKEEDPDAYMEYRLNLNEHREKVREFEVSEARKSAVEKMSLREVEEVSGTINDMLSAEGIVDSLVNYGTEVGFSQADLVALSQPQTKIVTGDGKTRYLGKGALAFLKHLDAGRTTNRETLKAEAEQEMRPKLEEEITKKLMSKFKNPESQQQSLDGQGEKGVSLIPDDLTEAQFNKLSPEDQERWLKE